MKVCHLGNEVLSETAFIGDTSKFLLFFKYFWSKKFIYFYYNFMI